MILTFGKGDRIALPKLTLSQSSLGSDVHYTHPSYQGFYSPYGFAVPLNYEAVPLHLIMDKKLPPKPEGRMYFGSIPRYLLVDHNGELWQTSFVPNENDKKLSYAFSYIDRYHAGWWIGTAATDQTSFISELTGYLYTNPEEDAITDFVAKHQPGHAIEWHHLPDIVQTLNTRHPRLTPASPTKGA